MWERFFWSSVWPGISGCSAGPERNSAIAFLLFLTGDSERGTSF
jgi:hypothetical protein